MTNARNIRARFRSWEVIDAARKKNSNEYGRAIRNFIRGKSSGISFGRVAIWPTIGDEVLVRYE